MTNIEAIKASPVYQEILRDSFGGVIYNVANRDKYHSEAIESLWASTTQAERDRAGGVMNGVFNFLDNKEQ